MKKIILAGIAVLGLSAGAASAATNADGYVQVPATNTTTQWTPNDAQARATVVPQNNVSGYGVHVSGANRSVNLFPPSANGNG